MNPTRNNLENLGNSAENLGNSSANNLVENSNNSAVKNSAVDPRAAADHARSVHDYPNLEFADNEYVVIDVERSKFGIFLIWCAVIFCAILLIAIILMIQFTSANFMTNSGENSINVFLLIFGITAFCILGGMIAQKIFNSNYLIITNERIFSRWQIAPFAHRVQTLELEHVEDCSYKQAGVLPSMFNYGTIRLSTVGDEQTYQFTFVRNPEQQFHVINKIVRQVDEGESTKYQGRGQK